MKNRSIMLVALMFIVIFTAAACSSSKDSNNNSSEQKSEPKTISFVIESTTDNAPYRAIFEQFEKETGHKVELQPLPGGAEYDNMIKTRFATGDFPDLFHMQPGTKQYVKLRAEETLHDWSSNETVTSRLLDSIKENQMMDGKIYGIPWGSTGHMGIYYNKEIFAEVGVEPPKNYADFLDIAEKVKAAGYTPFYEAVRDGWTAQIFYFTGWVSYVDQEIGEEGAQLLEKNELRMNEIDSLRNLFERQLEIYEKGYYQDEVLAGTYDEMQNEFGEGRVAMIFMLDGILPLLKEKFGDEFVNEKMGYFPFPSDEDAGVAMITQPSQLMVPKEAKNKDAAIELVEFMTRPEMVDLWYSMHPGIPIFENAKSELYPVQAEVLRHIENGNAMVNIQNRLTPTFVDFAKVLQTFFIEKNIDDAINAFDANYRRDGLNKRLPGFEQ